MFDQIKDKKIVGMKEGEWGYTGSKGFTILLEDGTTLEVILRQNYDDAWIDTSIKAPASPKKESGWQLIDGQEPPVVWE